MNPELPKKTVELGKLVLEFGQVFRTTRYPDKVTPESDTDHTVMLSLVACAFASTYVPRLDVGKVAQYALVHDFVEVYAGDTHTFGGLSEEQKKDKDAREAAALERLEKEFGAIYPWIHKTIEAYESLESAEARFVKTLDKAMPKITHLLNSGSQLPSKEAFAAHVTQQHANLSTSYGVDQPEALELLKELSTLVEKSMGDS